jgi:hypothetical protein
MNVDGDMVVDAAHKASSIDKAHVRYLRSCRGKSQDPPLTFTLAMLRIIPELESNCMVNDADR